MVTICFALIRSTFEILSGHLLPLQSPLHYCRSMFLVEKLVLIADLPRFYALALSYLNTGNIIWIPFEQVCQFSVPTSLCSDINCCYSKLMFALYVSAGVSVGAG